MQMYGNECMDGYGIDVLRIVVYMFPHFCPSFVKKTPIEKTHDVAQ